MMNLYDVPAPAKLNLFLHVVGRRPDGYHLLQTVFRFIGLSDTLHFERRGDGAIVRAGGLDGVPEQDDLTVRAARALQAATGTPHGASIRIDKRIPMGGGLGGGSSDAASTLIALNRLWNTGLTREQLLRLAGGLGADVPVFVFGRSAFAEGVGDMLTEISLPERAYLVAQPDASVPTPVVFSDPGLTRNTPSIRMADFSASPQNPPGPNSSVGFNLHNGLGFNLHNDLQPVAFRRYPEVALAASWLADALKTMSKTKSIGSAEVRMSGSGACLFAEFPDMSSAVLAEQGIAATIRVAGKEPGVTAGVQERPPRFRLVQANPGLIEHPLRHWIA
jgi:4-diphosphocytidyl-2-C-methyl-D-erythritol kinase